MSQVAYYAQGTYYSQSFCTFHEEMAWEEVSNICGLLDIVCARFDFQCTSGVGIMPT